VISDLGSVRRRMVNLRRPPFGAPVWPRLLPICSWSQTAWVPCSGNPDGKWLNFLFDSMWNRPDQAAARQLEHKPHRELACVVYHRTVRNAEDVILVTAITHWTTSTD